MSRFVKGLGKVLSTVIDSGALKSLKRIASRTPDSDVIKAVKASLKKTVKSDYKELLKKVGNKEALDSDYVDAFVDSVDVKKFIDDDVLKQMKNSDFMDTLVWKKYKYLVNKLDNENHAKLFKKLSSEKATAEAAEVVTNAKSTTQGAKQRLIRNGVDINTKNINEVFEVKGTKYIKNSDGKLFELKTEKVSEVFKRTKRNFINDPGLHYKHKRLVDANEISKGEYFKDMGPVNKNFFKKNGEWLSPKNLYSHCKRTNTCARGATALLYAGAFGVPAGIMIANNKECGKYSPIPNACSKADKSSPDSTTMPDWQKKLLKFKDGESTCWNYCMPENHLESVCRNQDVAENYPTNPTYRDFTSFSEKFVRLCSEGSTNAAYCSSKGNWEYTKESTNCTLKDDIETILDPDGPLSDQPFCSESDDNPKGKCRDYCVTACDGLPETYEELFNWTVETQKKLEEENKESRENAVLIIAGCIAVISLFLFFVLSRKKGKNDLNKLIDEIEADE